VHGSPDSTVFVISIETGSLIVEGPRLSAYLFVEAVPCREDHRVFISSLLLILPSLTPLKTRQAIQLASVMLGTENIAEYMGDTGARMEMATQIFKLIVVLERNY
jgi:hypothetical protein